MGQSDLDDVFRRALSPRAVAVYGASSRRLTSQAARITARLIAGGHAGRVALVNPRAQEVHGIATVPSASQSELADQIDLAIISVPKDSVIDAVEDCAKAGVELAVVTSNGFAEYDEPGARLQEELVRVARSRGVRLIGPNCMGLYNFTDRLHAAGQDLQVRPGKISVIAQSGFLSMRLLGYIAEIGQGIDCWITVGNCADLGPEDVLREVAKRESTAVAALYLENVGHPDRLREAIVAARATGTDVVVVKSGRTGAGSLVAASHTGALASPDVFFDVLAEESDCIRADSLREAAQIAGILATVGRPRGPFVAAGASGGDCVLAADAAAMNDVPLARLDPATIERVRAIVPQAASSNPMDVSPTAFELQKQNEMLAELINDPGVGGAILLDTWSWPVRETADGQREMDLGALIGADGKPVMPIIKDTAMLEPWQRQALVDAGVAVTSDVETVWRALGHIARRNALQAPLPEPRGAEPPVHGAASGAPAGPRRMGELEAFALLAEADVPMVATVPVASEDELLAACAETGYPVVLKGIAPGIIHKADLQLVRTDVWGDDAAVATWRILREALASHAGGTVIVQAQLRQAVAEVIVSTRDDERYGLHVMVGGGGGGVEADSDVAWARAPLSVEAAATLLRRTRIGRRLAAKRPEALADGGLPSIVARISELAVERRESIAEIEINPFLVTPQGAVAVDAVITLRDPES